ncbi:MAG: GGDEF domain-containing response regulator [Armatimonadota bacterium]
MRVLIAEDDPVTRRELEVLLTQWGYEPITCPNGETAWQILCRDDPPPMAVIDWVMPGIDGVELCQQVRELHTEPYTYILLLTVKDRKEDVIQGLEAGADDYVTKPFNALELRARLNTGRRIVELQKELIAAREELRTQATHDWLTGLWNRKAVLDILERELSRAARKETPVSVVMVDLDKFKPVNDTYGHLAGDTVLREAAKRMRLAVRAYDAVGRFGGDEFLIVLSECDESNALKLAERLSSALSEPFFLSNSDVHLHLGGSLGVATAYGASNTTADELIRAADAALYRAKNSKTERIALAQPRSSDKPTAVN